MRAILPRSAGAWKSIAGTAWREVLNEDNNQRRSDRLMCSELVEIAFQDQTGRWVRETGVIENVGSNGLGVSLNIPVSVERMVTVSNARFRSEATVKHCAFEEYGYLLGLEFSGDFQWNQADWEPEHLLRLPEE
jgi:hypothetical protein